MPNGDWVDAQTGWYVDHLTDVGTHPTSGATEPSYLGRMIAGGGDAFLDQDFDASPRRYAWNVLHHQTLPKDGDPGLITTIVTLHRADLNARYARQYDPIGIQDLIFDPGDDAAGGDQEVMKNPLADPDPDALRVFPQPWLVMFEKVWPALGRATCSPMVAGMLPVDSYFVVARSQGPFFAGTGKQVIRRSTYDDNGTTWPALEFERITNQGNTFIENVPVWVWPPAAVPLPNNAVKFAPRSPVVGMAIRSMQAQ